MTKADEVPDKISTELERHRKGASVLRVQLPNEYGLWGMQESEAGQVAEFLAERHVDRSRTAPARSIRAVPDAPSNPRDIAADARATRVACKHCGSTDLHAGFHFGYYWRCGKCGETMNMPTVCSSCGAKGRRGKGVRVRKDGKHYFRSCGTCGYSETIWTEGMNGRRP